MAKKDAIIALGGGISPDGRLANSSERRINMAVDLFRQGIAPHIVTSGKWSYRLDQEPCETEASAMKRHALARGVGETAIYTEEFSKGTIGNAYYIKQEILERQDWRKLAVVTCLVHAARTQMIFEHVLGEGYDISVYPTLESPDRNARAQADLQLAASARELAAIPRGDDQALENHFPYLKPLLAIGS